ncbi:MAG: 4Fe-4S dicluster domain-containing protein [Thermodesulfobacteriota bacterium]|nr:4Fe-4S dicluster domain-containing protein [Thermodesulfobacteriota bacterium]
MFYFISLYGALIIFIIGLMYKINSWFSLKISVDSKNASARFSAALKGVITTIFSGKILTLLKVFFLDIIVQRKVMQEDFIRWLAHILIYWAFMLLLFMHALDSFITSAIFPDYSPTINPFMFLRDLFGLLVIVGVCLAIYRRFIRKAPRLKTNAMDHYAIILLAIIMVSGILLEGAKIGSYSIYEDMVEEYAGLEDAEEIKPLTAFWVNNFGVVSPDIKGPFESELLEEGKELHEMSCAGCHSRPQWAFMGNSVAASVKGIALGLNNAGIHTLLWYIHFLACFIGLAYIPFSKFFHIFTTPLSILANSVMNREDSEIPNIETRQALELDACTHCGQCTSTCSAGIVFEQISNINILPSEKIQSLKKVASKQDMDKEELLLILDGTYLCTNCHRCTDVCPAGINLEDLWFSMRESMFQGDYPEFSILSPLSYYRGLMRETIPEKDYKKPLTQARDAVTAGYNLIKDQTEIITITTPDREFQDESLSSQASTFKECFGCQTCTNVCPIVANYENPKETLGLLPHQIMYSLGLGIKELALGSNMLWDCVTCYQCQEQCPQGVKITEVLFELKNLAIQNVKAKTV